MNTVLILLWSLGQLGFDPGEDRSIYAHNIDGPAYICYKATGGDWDTLAFVTGPHVGYEFTLPVGASATDSIKYIFPDPIAFAKRRQEKDDLPYPTDNDPLRLSQQLRKPAMEFGWDFAFRNIQTGARPPSFEKEKVWMEYVDVEPSKLWQPRIAGGLPRQDLPVGAVRQVELVTDDINYPFYLKINGQRVFMLGVNAVVPHDFDKQEALRKRLIEMWKSGGNTVRFWGGAYYPSDRILNTCDSLGIMVWQDFSYTGTSYPGDSTFRHWAQQEALYQIKRLSRHPSVVILCGNNEIDVAWNNWGWQKTYSMSFSDSSTLAANNQWLFDSMLPELVKEHGKAAYLSSSPTSNWGTSEDFKSGCNHDWRVWHGEQPTTVLSKVVAPFITEWGIPSLPSKKVLINWDSNLETYMLSYKGLSLLLRYLYQEEHYSYTGNVAELAEVSRRWQAKVIFKTLQAQEAAQPFCSGSLIWQLNDVDPVISWSLIDTENVPKPAWESAKKAWEGFIFVQMKE